MNVTQRAWVEKHLFLGFILFYWPVFEHFFDLRKKYNDLFIPLYVYFKIERKKFSFVVSL